MFEKEVKSKAREALTVDELREEEVKVEEVASEDDEEKKTTKEKREKRRLRQERDTKVRQAKIVRQGDRVDPVTGKGKSRGYGFLELNKHADALRVLRWANNNPNVGALMEDWYKDELSDIAKKLEGGLKEPKSEGGKEETKEENATRLKRIKHDIERLTSEESRKASKKALIIEFSIENVQVVNRRKEHQKERPQVSFFAHIFHDHIPDLLHHNLVKSRKSR